MSQSKETGIYIHIPFCRSKCAYCNFNSASGLEDLIPTYVDALTKEIKSRAHQAGPREARSLYFGGGTPTILSGAELETILAAIFENFALGQDLEITIEANPEGLSLSYLNDLIRLGFNRLSLGAQSFDDDFLHLLWRRHSAEEVERAVGMATRAGFGNINLDLILSSPLGGGKNNEMTLKRAISLKPSHISAYMLEIHKGTPLFDMVSSSSFKPLEEEIQAETYLSSIETLIAAGFNQYELSNFAKEGLESIHNMIYWRGGNYYGFGAGAHSFLGGRRIKNIEDPRSYVEVALVSGAAADSFEELSRRDGLCERIMLGLRLTEGLDLIKLEEEFSTEEIDQIILRAQIFVDMGLMTRGERLRLTPSGMLVSNDILARLIPD
ncbi:MAG: radical SAM family heme chaperone HemW [Actinomycetota bacterium]|nr:radical SAM family heme chaperone HemW [Actinomycetota bacterium]